jgi:hypothetical protein
MARYRIRDVARDEDNNPVVGASVSIRRESDNVQIAATTTGADGSFGLLEEDVKYPGPVKTVITALDGVVRQSSGRNTGQVGTFFMSDLMRAFAMMTDGVVQNVDNELAVSASGSSMDLSVATGFAFLNGHPSYWPEIETVTPAANGSGNPRKDLVIIRIQMPGTTEEGNQDITLLQGTPAASPVAPGVTQDPNTVWEIPLAEVTVPAGAATLSGGNVVDVREYSSGPLMDGSVITAKIADGAVTTAKIADETVTAAKLTAEAQVSTADIAKVLKAPLLATDPPAYTQLSIRELSDVQDAAPTSGQVLTWNATNSRYEPASPAALTLIIQEGDVTKVSQALVVDFTAAPFDVTESPTGEANIDIAAGGITNAHLAGSIDQGKLAAAIDATKIADGSVTNAEFQRINTVTSNVQDQLDAKASTSHTHEQVPSLMNNANKTYGYTAVTSTTGTTIIDCEITLLAGVTYDIHATGFGVLNAAAGQSITLGVKIGAGAVDWGTEVQVAGGDKAAFASALRTVTGASGQTVALQCKVSGGTGSITDGHVTVFAVPRNVPAS